MKLRFWGTRGSTPQPSPEALEFGGDTICTQFFYDDEDSKYFLLDMGTGIIDFGKTKPFKNEYHIIISSFYWDYIQGLPFFMHIHRPEVTLYFHSPVEEKMMVKNLDSLFDGTYSPLERMNNLRAKIILHKLNDDGYILDGVKITHFQINRKKLVYAIKFECNKKIFVYAGNFEIDPNHPKLHKMIEFIRNADIFVCDAQYTELEYNEKKGWGHSKIENSIDLAVKSNVKKLLLFHHDPFNADNFLKGYLEDIKRNRDDLNDIIINFAKEGEENSVIF